jgi:hypothetical protein
VTGGLAPARARGAQRRLRGLVGLHSLTPRCGFVLGGVTDLRLRVGAHRGQLGLELLRVGQHAERVPRALQVGGQPGGYRAQRRAREAQRTVPPALLGPLAADQLAGGGAAAALAERALRVVLRGLLSNGAKTAGNASDNAG